MYRKHFGTRPNWQQKLSEQGMPYHSLDNCIYWDENTCYEFSADEIDSIEEATTELHSMCLEAVDHVISNDLFHQFHIPENYVPYIRKSWDRGDPYVYGRFDLSFDGVNEPKMLEYNADTPTMLPETAIIQWFWLQDWMEAGRIPKNSDQFNGVHDALIEAWRGVAPKLADKGTLYFTTSLYKHEGRITNLEDYQNVQYMRDVCSQAGVNTALIDVGDIGWNGKSFTDLDEQSINALYKLYPWEFIAREQFGPHVQASDIQMIEPVWKMILSNKAILPVLWELFEGHPNLLPASFNESDMKGSYVKKPLLGREGANVTIVDSKASMQTGGLYGAEGHVYQVFHSAPEFEGNYPIIGSWVIASPDDFFKGHACGMGIREDKTPVTNNNSRFIPHYIAG